MGAISIYDADDVGLNSYSLLDPANWLNCH